MIEIKNVEEALTEANYFSKSCDNLRLMLDMDNGDVWFIFKDSDVESDNIIDLSAAIKASTGKEFYRCDKQMIELCATEAIKKRL